MIRKINNGHRFRFKLLTTQVTMNKQLIAGGSIFIDLLSLYNILKLSPHY